MKRRGYSWLMGASCGWRTRCSSGQKEDPAADAGHRRKTPRNLAAAALTLPPPAAKACLLDDVRADDNWGWAWN